MKATLFTLLALGSFAMADEPAVTLSDMLFTTTVPQDKGNSGGSYGGIVMTISEDNDRLTTKQTWTLGDTYQLTSIELADRNLHSTALKDTLLILADANNKFMASSGIATLNDAKHDSDWGWDYTRPFATYTSFLDKDDKAVTLNVGTQYRLFVTTEEKLESFFQSGVDTLSINDVNTPDLFACGKGTYDTDTVTNLGFLTKTANLALTAQGYAPLVGITVSPVSAPVPEPATGTLSLLALAGLAARRRRK